MFQLIVSVIAIALVAVLAAASIYYGGAAFSNSTAKGNVTALINGGQQISGASALYKVDWTVAPADISALVASSSYLAAAPMPPKFAAGTWSADGANGIAYIALSTASATSVCNEVLNQGGLNNTAGTFNAATAVADLGSTQFGCIGDTFAYKM